MKLSEDLIVGAPAAAAFVGVSPQVIYRLAAQGEIHARKMGKRLYFSRAALTRAFAVEPSVGSAAASNNV